jgi:L-seryl-tRNA(Ser) seleniumtransferase
VQDVHAQVIDGESTIGGGSAPGSVIPTRLLAISHPALRAAQLEERLRKQSTPIIARIQDDRVVLDLRTVAPEDDDLVIAGIADSTRFPDS